MSEIAGIVIGAVGLVALESTVEELFQKVASWKSYDKNYKHYCLKLEMTAIAYERWRRSVKLADDENTAGVELPIANPKEAQTVKDLLGAIVTAFERAEESTKQPMFKTLKPTDRCYEAPDSIRAKSQAAVEKRKKGTGAWKKLRWVVHDKQALSTLTERVEDYVERLVCLFPGAVEETQKMIATLELGKRVPTDSPNKRVKLVEVSNASAKVDCIMQQVATESIKRVDERHRFLQNRVEEGARAAYGDAYGKSARFQLDGPGSVFQGNVVTGHGSRATYGDRVNMPDLLTSASHSDGDSSEQDARG